MIQAIALCRTNKYFCDQQVVKISVSLMAQHGIFYMENAGGYKPAHPEATPSTAADERQPSCFALEEERGEHWTGSGAMTRVINEARPSL